MSAAKAGGAHGVAEVVAAASALSQIARLCVPGCAARAVDFAHLRSAANAGTGLRPHDIFGVSLCLKHHDEQHCLGADAFGSKGAGVVLELSAIGPAAATIGRQIRE